MWKDIMNYLRDLSNDDSKLETIIDEQMIALVKEEHPDDYEDFLEKKSEQLSAIKKQIKAKYKNEVHPRISNLLDPSMS